MKNVSILRHGDAKYENLHVKSSKTKYEADQISDFLSFADENKDLREDKISQLSSNIKDFLNENKANLQDKEIIVWISPFGRTLQTAQKLIEGISSAGFSVSRISIVQQLEEVKNFSRFVFKSLVDGGIIENGDQEVVVDKNMTNPDNLSTTNYFFEGAYRNISADYLESLGLKDKILSIETYKEITNRSQKSLARILNAAGDNKYIFLVSHQAFTDWILKAKEGYKNGGQLPGTFVSLDKEDFTTLYSE